jgi:hypothetical protein
MSKLGPKEKYDRMRDLLCRAGPLLGVAALAIEGEKFSRQLEDLSEEIRQELSLHCSLLNNPGEEARHD